jgi:ParB-like chromosome segregation protein Spo0J
MSSQQTLELAVVYRDVGSLRPYPHNARTHSKRQIRQIADSIKEFGFTNPVLIDRNNTIVAAETNFLAERFEGGDVP